MRKPLQKLLFLVGILSVSAPWVASADEVTDISDTPQAWHMRSLRVGANKLRTSLANDPDTIWIGHISDAGWVPKDRNGNPVPSSARNASGAPTVAGTVPVGGYGPYHVGRGDNLPGGDVTQGVAGGAGTSWNGVWDWDHYQAGDDSLQGWWPIARPGQSEGAGNTNDKVRGFFGLNYGNQGNYVINQGGTGGSVTGAKRTFGVTGYWHRDAGNGATPAYVDGTPTVPGPNVEWAPLGGTQSAWCGLRANDDFNAIDAVSRGGTGNPINQRVLEYNGNNSFNQTGAVNTQDGTDKNFPGYGSQWDQILYRDIDVSTINVGDNLSVSFSYVHALSPDRGGTSTQRVGYFWKDPLRPTKGIANDGNYVSAAEAEPSLAGPVDSFTVTLGVPVEPVAGPPGLPNDFIASDGNPYEIYDLKRRWFSEVVATTQSGNPAAGAPMVELLSRSRFSAVGGGVTNPPFTAPPATAAFTVSIKRDPAGTALEKSLDAICSSGAGKVRIAFRVLTNRGNDDEDNFVSAFSSFTRGAAIIDNVVIQRNGAGANLISNGDFESDNSINNDTAVSATAAWKSTGKPPGVYVHPHCINTNCTQYTPGIWNDPCSPPTLTDPKAGNRACNMVGNVLSGGDHDVQEKPGGLFGANDQDRQRLGVSPTIIIATNQADATQYNPMGLNKDIIAGATEWALWFDVHTAGFRGAGGNGNLRSVGMQNYPARQANGAPCWGETRWSTAITFNQANACGPNLVSLLQAGFVNTSNVSGIPDSIRVHFQYISRCYTGSLTSVTCSPTSGTQVGNYIDNLSFSIMHGIILAGLTNFPWMYYADAFPSYLDASGLPKTSFASSDFDTAAAKVRTGYNRNGLTGTTARQNVPADSAQVTSGAFPNQGRLDLVFRILPGPGNFVTAGNKLSQIRKVPTSLTPAVGNATSTNFWENYMANTGAFGTGGNGTTGIAMDPDGAGPIVAGTRWDWNAWCSARMDTLETNIWPALSNNANLAANSGGSDWQTTYHEQDPRYAQLGVAKNRCFLANPAAGQSVACKSRTPASTVDCNVVCELLPGSAPFGVFPPTWAAAAGLVAENGLPLGQTYEFTQIIPDGQLTPGSLVQYFYRRAPGLLQPIDIWPDTTQVFDGLNAFDGGRWYNFKVLPDNWKKSAYGGQGLLCMLAIDQQDRGGDEFFWVSAADSIGLTEQGKRGAHNGFYAPGGDNAPGTFSLAVYRRDNGGQPGTMWDWWDTKAGESQVTGSAWLSGRLTAAAPAASFMDGKTNTIAPTGDMLRFFYKSLVYLTGTAVGTNFGAVPDRGDDDLAQLNDFALLPTSGLRAVLVWGSGFAEDLTGASGGPVPAGGPAFLNTFFGASLTNISYRGYSGNVAPVAHYDENPGSAHDLAGAQSGLTYGLSDGCGIENDVLKAEPAAATGAAVQTFSENVGGFGPYPASIFVPAGGSGSSHPQITLIDGTRINRVTSFANALPGGKRNFLFNVLKNLAITSGAVSCGPLASPVGVGDDPITGSTFVNFLKLRSSNPMHAGEARLAFGLAKSEKVEVRVFDVTGRSVKTVANRVFTGGTEHVVVWDGTDEAGNKVKSGVYFYQLKTPTWTSQKKLAVLSN